MMTTRLEDLKPSSQAAIPPGVLKDLPLKGIYIWPCDSATEPTRTFRIEAWNATRSIFHYSWPLRGGWSGLHECVSGLYDVRYPRLPRLSFAKTTVAISTPGDQPSGRCKSITRRGKLPRWCKPGALFLAVDKIRAPGARGLGVFRVTSVERVGRWVCPHCGKWLEDGTVPGNALRCRPCDVAWAKSGSPGFKADDSLTPHELALEGCPDMTPDQFWAMLEETGGVREGWTWRIAFEAV